MQARHNEKVLLEKRKAQTDIHAIEANERKQVESFLRSQRGAFSVDSAWNIGFALLFIGILIPIGISQINAVNTESWTTTQVTVWGLLGTVAILTVAFAVYKGVRGSGGGRRRGGM